MMYYSTRGQTSSKRFEDVLMEGLAEDGGLYLPEKWPQINLEHLENAAYNNIADAVMSPFMPGIDIGTLAKKCYGDAFTHQDVAPLKQLNNTHYVMELFHGPTLAFKDYALQMLGLLFDEVLKKQHKRLTIIGATSGDTGSAAIEACRGRENIDIFILHPHKRTSEVQRRQMTTVLEDNVFNIALEGSFDDCQNIVKALFNDKKMRAEHHLSAVNSINWARICAQIVYYFYAGLRLGAARGKHISFAVPTGNFGNVFAAYCAFKMGLPVKHLIIGTNKNDILTRFFETGEMRPEHVSPSLSPSMDIQISSNFERYLSDFAPGKASKYMTEFATSKSFNVTQEEFDRACQLFKAYRCDDEQTKDMISRIHQSYNYIIDPHTAVGMHAAMEHAKLQEDDDDTPIVSLACAHPAKFPEAVYDATGQTPELPKDLADLYQREERVHVLPNNQDTIADFISQNANR